MCKRVTIIILLCIIFLGAFLRFYNITEKGFFVSDESFFAMVAKTLATTPKVLFDAVLNHRDNLGSHIKEQLWWGAQNTTARPGFIFPVAILMMILGAHDYVPFIFNAFLGTLTILLIYLVSLSMFKSKKIALLASFFLAISNYHILYSRSGIAQVTTGFFLTLAVWLYLRTFNKDNNLAKNLFLTGLCLGYLLSTHDSTIPIIGFLVLFDLIFMSENLRARLFRLFSISFGVLLVVAIWELILGARKLIANIFNLSTNVHTYLEELFPLFWHSAKDFSAAPDRLFYFDLFNRLDGLTIIILLLLGIFVFLLKKDWRDKKVFFLFVLTWFVLIFWSGVPLKVPRTLTTYIPILTLFSAYSLWGLVSVLKNKVYQAMLVVFVAGLIFIFNLNMTFQILNLRSGYKESANYLKNYAPSEIMTAGASWMHYEFYLNRKLIPPGQSTEGFNVLVSDWSDKDSWQEFAKQGRLVGVFQNSIGKFYPTVRDYYFGRSADFAEGIVDTPQIGLIGIFEK